jgi:hypothetical protein
VPKPGTDAKAAFQELIPKHPAVGIRPMFGNLVGFANGNYRYGWAGGLPIPRLLEVLGTETPSAHQRWLHTGDLAAMDA